MAIMIICPYLLIISLSLTNKNHFSDFSCYLFFHRRLRRGTELLFTARSFFIHRKVAKSQSFLSCLFSGSSQSQPKRYAGFVLRKVRRVSFPLGPFIAQPLRPLPSTNLGYAVRAALRADASSFEDFCFSAPSALKLSSLRHSVFALNERYCHHE